MKMKPTIRILVLMLCVGCRRESHPQVATEVPPTIESKTAPTQLTPDPQLEKLVTQLASADVEERRNAAYAMGQSGGLEAVPHLIKALDDPDLYVRTYGIQSLRDRRDARAVTRLCELLTEQASEPQIVSNVMRALGAIRSPLAVPRLIAALESDDAFTRYDAAFVLGEIGDPTAIPALEKLLSDKTKPERKDGLTMQSTIYSVGEQAQRSLDALQRK